MALYGRIALARLLAEALQVGDLNTAPVVIDEAKLLQAVGDSGDMGSLDAEHLREEFLREPSYLRWTNLSPAVTSGPFGLPPYATRCTPQIAGPERIRLVRGE